MLPSTFLPLLNVLFAMLTFSTLAYASPIQVTIKENIATLLKNCPPECKLRAGAEVYALLGAFQVKIQPRLQELANPRANGRDPSENVASITTSIQTATFNISQLNLSSAAPATAQMTTELINRITSIHDQIATAAQPWAEHNSLTSTLLDLKKCPFEALIQALESLIQAVSNLAPI